MKHFFIVLTLVTLFLNVHSQTATDSVKAVINKMFTGMKQADGNLLKSTFSDSVIFQTIGTTEEGDMVVKTEDPARFIDQVSQASPGSLDERISFETVKVDGPLAIVWTPYTFYYKGNFSHCGVNSFQLVRLNGQWKIQYIIDTRRKQHCPE